jgi:hypothetical protein
MTTEKTKKVIFHNSEEIQPESWEMQGVSAKLNEDEAIGKFGTGLCYAIAVLLRTGHKISIKSGNELYEFGLIDLNFRGKDFKRITCNGKPLSFTTHYGHTWDVWGAYRELVSNCMDEGGIHFLGEPMEEGTSIIVEGKEFQDCLAKHEEYFLGDREPIATTETVDIYEGRGIIYHKGVKVGEVQNASYSYHIKQYIQLTEDRTYKYDYQIYQAIGGAITKKLKDKTLLERFICMKGNYEAILVDYDWTWSDEFQDVCKDLWAKAPAKINERIQKLIRKKMKDATFEFIEFSEDEELMIDKAKGFLGRAGYPINSPIKKVESEDTNVIAYEYNRVIHLTQKAFDEGMFLLAVALFEEQQHCNGYLDMERTYQMFLTKELIKQAKKALKETL